MSPNLLYLKLIIDSPSLDPLYRRSASNSECTSVVEDDMIFPCLCVVRTTTDSPICHFFFILISFHFQSNTPGWTRTINLRLRRALLYPIELQAQNTLPNLSATTTSCSSSGCITFLLLRVSRTSLFHHIVNML